MVLVPHVETDDVLTRPVSVLGHVSTSPGASRSSDGLLLRERERIAHLVAVVVATGVIGPITS